MGRVGWRPSKEWRAVLMYTKQMEHAWKKIPKPVKGLKVAIVEYPQAYFVRVYEDNIMQFSEADRVKIMSYLEQVRKTLESFRVPCHIEGINGIH